MGSWIGANNRVYIWHKDDEKYNPHLICPRSERKISLMIWGCICHDGVGRNFDCCRQGRIQHFLMGVADTNRPPNYTFKYFKLSYVCPKTWRFRKDELETVTLQTLERYFYILGTPRISVCFSTYYIFLVGCSKRGWLATQSTPPPGSSPGRRQHKQVHRHPRQRICGQ